MQGDFSREVWTALLTNVRILNDYGQATLFQKADFRISVQAIVRGRVASFAILLSSVSLVCTPDIKAIEGPGVKSVLQLSVGEAHNRTAIGPGVLIAVPVIEEFHISGGFTLLLEEAKTSQRTYLYSIGGLFPIGRSFTFGSSFIIVKNTRLDVLTTGGSISVSKGWDLSWPLAILLTGRLATAPSLNRRGKRDGYICDMQIGISYTWD